MVTIVSRPSVNIPSSPTDIVSRFVAAFNPIVYTFNFSTVPDAAYSLRIRIFEVGSDTLLSDLSVRPLGIGNLRVDLSRYIKKYLASSYEPDFTSNINDKESKSVLRFYITYQEFFIDGSSGTLVSDSNNYINATLSAKQIGDMYGQNMREYTPFGKDGLLAKFLTKFETPVKWNSWPFTLSFIYSQDLAGVELKIHSSFEDINQDEISSNETSLDTSKINFINFLKLTDNIPIDNKFINVNLSTGSPVPDTYVYDGYVDDGYVEVR